MKSIFLPLFLASAAALTSAAEKPAFDGNWHVHNSIAGNESDIDCTFAQKDNEITGNCNGDNGGGKATGKIDGLKITWSYDAEYNGSPLTVKYSGTLASAGGKIAGTVSVEQFSVDGDFTATLSK